MLIGLIADTHTPMRGEAVCAEVYDVFRGVDLILHAGDIVAPVVLDCLEDIAPVLAARGNNDRFDDHRMRDVQYLDAHGQRLAVFHDAEPEHQPLSEIRRMNLGGEHADIMITGHTHYERIDYREGVLQINPGSSNLPHLWSYRLGTVALFEWDAGVMDTRIVRLGETEGLANPGIEYTFSLSTGVVDPRVVASEMAQVQSTGVLPKPVV